METSKEEMQKQLNAAQKLIQDIDIDNMKLKHKVENLEDQLKALQSKGIVFTTYAAMQRASKIYDRTNFWLITEDALDLYDCDKSKRLTRIQTNSLRSLILDI